MADPFINSLTASGVYRQLFDRSRVVTNASTITPIIFGFSKKGLFNTAVFCPDSEFFISNFGAIDYSLERKGSFFHRAALEMLEQGPIFVVNLYNLSAESPDTPPATEEEYYAQLADTQFDLTDYKGFSLGSTIFNKPGIIEPVVNFYNKERFWFADTEALNATNGSNDQLISFVNLSQKSVSVITKKSDITGFNVTAKEWYGVGNVPDFMAENDYIEDYFIDVIVFEGDFTNYEALAIDPVFGPYFDPQFGFRKELLAEFAALPQVNVLGQYSGSVIPDFIDQNGSNRYIQTLVNQDTTLTGVLCAVNEEVFDDEFLSGTKVDLVGHDIERKTNEGLNRIEFLSYKDTIVSDLTFTQRQLDITATGSYDNVGFEIQIDGQIAAADESTVDSGRYILDGQNIIDVTENSVAAEAFSPINGQTVITLANVPVKSVTEVRVGGVPAAVGTDYNVNLTTGEITFVTPFVGGESVEVDYLYNSSVTILQPAEGYIVRDLDTANAGASELSLKYSAGSWAETQEIITTVEDRITNAAAASGVPAGLYIQDDTGEIVAVEAGAVSAVIATPAAGYVVINKDEENVVQPEPAYLKYEAGSTNDWIALDGTEVLFNGITLSVGTASTLYTTLTTDYQISELADHVYLGTIDIKFTKILQAGENLGFLDLTLESGSEQLTVNYNVMIDPIYFDYDVSENAYIVTSGVGLDIPELYTSIENGTIVSGDTVTYDDGSGLVDAFIKVSAYQDDLNFNYPSSATSSEKVFGYLVQFFSEPDLAAGNQLTGADVPLFGETYSDGVAGAADELIIQTLKGSLNETFTVTQVAGVPNEFILPAAEAGEIVFGQYIVSNPGSASVPSRMTRVNRITTLQNGDQQIRTDDPVFINKASVNDTTGTIERYQRIDEFVDFLDLTHLYGFRIKDRQLPQPGDGDVSTYSVLTSTNLYNTLKDRSIINYRYIIDTFNKGITAGSKSILTSLARDYKNAIAICNGPSAKQFSESTDPIFTDAPTQTNPNPELNHRFITTGGNQALNPQGTYSLPGESQGGAYGAFYYPNLVVNERNKNFTVPPAMYVGKNFINKHREGNPWDIIAGARRGLLTGRNVVGIETVLTTDDRAFLEPFGLNPITNEPGVGLKINSNQTAKQQVVSALSFVNVTEAIIEIQKGIEAILQNFLWEFNTAENRLQIKTLADNFLEQIKIRNGVYDYENVMDSSNNPNSIIDQQKGVIDTYVEPVKGLGILVHRTTILNTGQIESGDFVRLS